jgi:predicted metal-dependent phosphoesterase TrpH
MYVDLHLHTTASDGRLAPTELVTACAEAALDVIAITDHDTIAGSIEGTGAARGIRIQVIPAIEISASGPDFELHILGYFVDPSSAELRAFAKEARDQRERRLREMLDRLKGQGVHVAFETVAAAAEGGGVLGRPHLARAIVSAGYATSEQDAFERFIGNACPAYIPNSLVNPEEGIALIARAGGVPVWAHPPVYQIDDLLPTLIAFGLQGLEVYRPGTLPGKQARLESAARASGLLVSGGSDWHGPDAGPVGTFRLDADRVEELLGVGGI